MPNIDVFVTSILSNPQLRGRHERVRRALGSARVPYAEHDVAGDKNAKSLWKRKNGGKNELPFILVDGEPVGNIDDMDEAVEFGELRQFLRLDSPQPPPPPMTPTNPSSSSTPSTNTISSPPVSTNTTRTPPPPPKPSLDDFADLDLSEAELAELAREISNGDTFSSGLGSNAEPYHFNDATRRFEGSTAPLKVEKINFTRALPDRPLASEVVRDELEGIEQGDLDIDELEQLAKELEAEELERRRLRDAQVGNGSTGIEPPPLPEKESPTPPALPKKGEEEDATSTSTLPREVAESTSVEGMGGASLSAPLAEIEQLHISTLSTPATEDLKNKTLTLESPLEEETPTSPKFADTPATIEARSEDSPTPPAPTTKSLFSSVADVFTPSSSNSTSTTAGQVPERKKFTPVEVEHLKKSLEGGQAREKEMPSFGVADMDPDHRPASPEAAEDIEVGEEASAGATRQEETLEDRVAQAIKGGDL